MSAPTQPPGVPQMLELAQKAANATDWNRASDLLADAPEEVRVLDKRAFYLSRAKRYDEALALLAILRAKEPANFLWPHMTGYQFYVQGLYGEAVPWLLAAYRLNPKHLRNLYRLAQARRHQGELLRAKRAAGEVLKLWHALPADAQERESRTLAKASYLLGQLQADKDPRGALDLFRQAVEHDPSDHDKHYRLGKTHRRLGQPNEAVAALTRARRIKPRCIYIELELADALRLTGETETAFRHLATAMPGARVWQALKAARIAHELGRNDDAARMLHVAAGACPMGNLCASDARTPSADPPPAMSESQSDIQRDAYEPGILPLLGPVPYLTESDREARAMLAGPCPSEPTVWLHATSCEVALIAAHQGLIPSCWHGGHGCVVFGCAGPEDAVPPRGDAVIEIKSRALPGQQRAWWVPWRLIRGAWMHGKFVTAQQLRDRPLLREPEVRPCACPLSSLVSEQQVLWRSTWVHDD